MLPPMIIFTGKTDQTICSLIIPPGFIVKTHEKTWIGYDLTKVWVEEILLKHTQAEFQNVRGQGFKAQCYHLLLSLRT